MSQKITKSRYEYWRSLPETEAFFDLIKEQEKQEIEELRNAGVLGNSTDSIVTATTWHSAKLDLSSYFIDGFFEDDFIILDEEEELDA